MNQKITVSLLGILLAASLSAQVKTVNLNLGGGSFMGTPIPDYTRWYYFSFEKGDTIGSSPAVLDGVSPAQIGSEAINEEWKARTDWDIAFHANDIRTNSGAAGNGLAGALKIEGGDTPLSEVFAGLTQAPAAEYAPDEILTGSFIFGMASMPPLRTVQLSASAATSGWVAFGMNENTENPIVVVFKTTGGKYAKVHLKKFFDEEGMPGVIEFDYELIPAASGSGAENLAATGITVYSSEGGLHVETVEKADIYVYSISGALVGKASVRTGQTFIPVPGRATGIYIVKAVSANAEKTQKIILK